MVYVVAILIGLFFVGVLGFEAGFFAALTTYLFGTLYQQKHRLVELEAEVRRLGSIVSAMRRAAADAEQAVPVKPEAKAESVTPRPAEVQAARKAAEEEPLELDVDFDILDEPASFSPPGYERPARPPEPPVSESYDARLLAWIKSYFTGGNLMVRVGIVVLFFGVAFLLKYAAEHSLLPIELRLAGTAIGGIALLIFGWRLRHKRENYALTLQGGAVGVLYLTVFAALRLYSVIPPGLAFGLLLLFVALSALLALLQDSRALIVLASAGGFLAPVLTSTGEGSHVALFSYYLLLNAGILLIAWFKAWRVLNLVGFAFTFVIGALWGAQYYRPEFFSTTEPFLIAFFLLYVGIAVLFALRQPPDLKGVVDGSLVFGVPLIAAGLQAALVKDYEYGLAFSALALGGFYILLASVLFKRGGQPLRMLSESFLATGVVFATLTVPFAFEGRITSAFWALEGAAMVWVGLRQSRLIPRLFGAVLQVLAGLFYLGDAYRVGQDIPLLNGLFLGTSLIALGGLFSSFYLERLKERTVVYEQLLARLFFVWGFVWWLGGCIREIEDFSSFPDQWAWMLGVLALTSVLSEALKTRLDWPRLRYAALGLLPLLLLVAVGMRQDAVHPLMGWNLAAWPVALAAHYWLLRHYDDIRLDVIRFWHAGAFWLIIYLLSYEASWQLNHWVEGSYAWRMIPWALIPMLIVTALLRFGRLLTWPVGRFYAQYTTFTLAPVILYLLGWAMFANATSRGDPWPLDYLPVINPLDLVILFSVLVALKWWRTAGEWLTGKGLTQSHALSVMGAVLFLWLNGMVTRTVHHWGGVPFHARAMFDSQVFQASISVLWAVIGLSGMLLGTWLKRRFVWMLGAGLMGVVVVKLFIIDLSNTGTVARIVSFIGVGLLLLIVGYFSPAPPREITKESEE